MLRNEHTEKARKDEVDCNCFRCELVMFRELVFTPEGVDWRELRAYLWPGNIMCKFNRHVWAYYLGKDPYKFCCYCPKRERLEYPID